MQVDSLTISERMMVIASNTQRFSEFQPLFPKADIVDYFELLEQRAGIHKLLDRIRHRGIHIVVLVNRPPMNLNLLVNELRSTPAGQDLYIGVVTPHDVDVQPDFSSDVDDYISLIENGANDKLLELAVSRYERNLSLRARFVEASRSETSYSEKNAVYGSLIQFFEESERYQSIEEFGEAVYQYLNQRQLNVIFCIDSGSHAMLWPQDNTSTSRQFMLAELAQSSKHVVIADRLLGFSFHHLTLLISNCPIENSEQYEELQDSLAHFCTLVESRIRNILIKEHISNQHQHVMQIMDLIRASTLESMQHRERTMLTLAQEIELAATTFDMNQEEEEKLMKIAHTAAETLQKLQDNDLVLESHLLNLVEKITSIKTLATEQTDDVFVRGHVREC